MTWEITSSGAANRIQFPEILPPLYCIVRGLAKRGKKIGFLGFDNIQDRKV